jgi:Ger(x)C family germination protein
MKKSIVILVISVFAAMVFLTGCSGAVEVNNRAFVQLIGIDLKDEIYTVSLQIFESQGSGGNTDTSKSYSAAIHGTGNTILSAISDAEISQGKKLFLGHTKVIVIGKSVKNPVKDLSMFLDEGMSPSCLIVYSDNPAQIIETKMSGGMYSAQYLLMIMQNNYQHGKLVYTTLSDLASAKNSAPVPVIESEEDIIKFNGLCLMKDDGSAGIMPSDEVLGVKFLRNEVLSNDSITIPVALPEGNTAVSIRSSETKRCTLEENGIITFSVDITVDADIKENPGKLSNSAVSDAVKAKIEQLCRNAFYTSVSTHNSDIFDIYKYVRKYTPQSMDLYNSDFSNTRLDLTVDVRLNSVKK